MLILSTQFPLLTLPTHKNVHLLISAIAMLLLTLQVPWPTARQAHGRVDISYSNAAVDSTSSLTYCTAGAWTCMRTPEPAAVLTAELQTMFRFSPSTQHHTAIMDHCQPSSVTPHNYHLQITFQVCSLHYVSLTIVCLFCLVFKGTFSTYKLYRAIGVWNIYCIRMGVHTAT